jgi:hypothetical protein
MPPFSLQSLVVEAKLQRRPGSTLCAFADAEVLVPRLPERRPLHVTQHRRWVAVSLSSYVPDEPPFPVAPAFELSPPVLHHATHRAKSQPPHLRRQPHRRAKHAASLPPITALASPPPSCSQRSLESAPARTSGSIVQNTRRASVQ